jgi:hypothetical protein
VRGVAQLHEEGLGLVRVRRQTVVVHVQVLPAVACAGLMMNSEVANYTNY